MKKILLLLSILIAHTISAQVWQKVLTDGYYIYDMEEMDNGYLYMAKSSGSSASLWRSTTGGLTSGSWTNLMTKTGFPNTVSEKSVSANGTDLYMGAMSTIAAKTGVFYSADYGETWSRRINGLGADTAVTGVQVLPNGTVFAFTQRTISTNKVYRSTDKGLTWSLVVNAGSDFPREIVYKNSSNLFMEVGSILYKSTNGGSTWNSTASPYTYDIVYSATKDSFYVSSSQQMFRSKDCITWEAYNYTGFAASATPSILRLLPNDTLYATNSAQATVKIYRSPDLGKTWSEFTTGFPTTGYMTFLAVKSSGYIFAAPTGDVDLYRTATPAFTLGTQEQTSIFSDFTLAPNPVSTGYCKLTFTLTKSSDLQFELLDQTGKMLSIPGKSLNDTYDQGIHELNLEVSGLKVGMYVLKVNSEGANWSEKLVVR